MDNECYLGVDLGGTQIRTAAVSREGVLLTPVIAAGTGEKYSPSALGLELKNAVETLQTQIGNRALKAVGMGITGIVGTLSVSQADFLPLLNDLNLIELITDATGLPARIENDARCFALAEARFGAARGLRNIVGITLGTGVGGGVIVEGQLLRGAHSNAGEVWGIPLRGKWLEHFLSTSGLLAGYKAAGGEHDPGDAKAVAVLARSGDSAACASFESYSADLWVLCQTLHAILDPELIVIGGSIAQASDLFGASFAERLALGIPQIAWAMLGREAGVIGAASLNL